MSVVSAFVESADLKLRQPHPDLQPYVGCFWSFWTTNATRLRGLPDACSMIYIDGLDDGDLQCLLVGPRTAATESLPGSGHLMVGVRLQPGVAFSLTGQAVRTLIDQRAPFSTIFRSEGFELERVLQMSRDADARIDILEKFLLRRLIGARIEPRVQLALELIGLLGGQVRIAQVAEHCGLSVRHLNRLLRLWVGLSCKRVIMIARFQALLRRLETPSPGGWATLAAASGYYDQPHLSNNVTEFTGVTPQLLSDSVADFSKTRCQ